MTLKTYVCEWGLELNDPNTVGNLTSRQKQLIHLAERAEAYIQQEQRNRQQQGASGSVSTKSGLENRASKRKRIQAAKKRN